MNKKPDVKGKVLSEGAPHAPGRRYRKPRLAARLLVGKIDKDSGPFLQILERVKQISEMPEDEGEGAAPLAIDIANILNRENSKKVRDILYTLINELK